MKRALILSLILMFLATPAIAGKRVTSQYLRVSNSAVLDTDIANAVTLTTDGLNVGGNVGFLTLLVTEEKAGGAGDIDVYAEYSLDGTNFYRPYTTDMAGTIVQEGNIVTALQNATRWIVITPRMAKWFRVVVDPDADSNITLQVIFQEEY